MKHLTKTDRQRNEQRKYLQHKLAWKISLQYSKILNDNINKSNVIDTVPDIYFQYIQSLRSNGLINIRNKNNHISVWETLYNTCMSNKVSDKFKRFSIRQLYHTSLKKNN
jgi:hypothetical protein